MDNIHRQIAGKTQYSPYFACILGMDAEWTRRRSDEMEAPYRAIQNQLSRLCNDYAIAIDKHQMNLHGDPQGAMRSHLFNPVFYTPWGHADSQAIVLMDDFDAIHHITSCLDSSIEELSIGFCPQVSGLGAGNPKDYFVELGELFETSEPSTNPDRKPNDRPRDFQLKHPLLVFTRYKYDAFAQLGFAILFQEALYEAMAKTVAATIYRLSESPAPLVRGSDFEPGDENAIRIALLDLQGMEELGTLMFCRNYTIAMSIMARIRALTYGDLFQASDAGRVLREAMEASRVFDRLASIQSKTSQQITITQIEGNHVFRWTNSTLSVSPHAFFADEQNRMQNCHGNVRAVAEFQVPPGHLRSFCDRVETEISADKKKKSTMKEAERKDTPRTTRQLNSELAWYEVGRGDFLVEIKSSNEGSTRIDDKSSPRQATNLQISPESANEVNPGRSVEIKRDHGFVKLSDVIEITTTNLKIFGTIQAQDTGRDVVDCSTVLSIPTLPIDPIHSRVGSNHTPIFGNALREIQKRLFYSEPLGATEAIYSETVGRLNLSELRAVPRTYGMPVALRRTIESLYQDYAILFGDYYEFDGVIDLYDSFATLHATLTDRLLHVRRAEFGTERFQSGIPLLDDRRVSAISSFVGALQNALSHRRTQSFSDPVIRDMSIDLRGGLNQFIAASDVPLKCGLGLLRKHALPRALKRKRDAVGGLTRISIHPGMRAKSLRLGTGKSSHLCYVEADVPHVMHVASFCDYFHEAAHLIFESLTERNPKSSIASIRHRIHRKANESSGTSDARFESKSKTESARHAKLIRTRLNEVFALMFTRIFLFPSQPLETFVVHHLIANEKFRNGVKGDDHEMLCQISELLVRLCIADLLAPMDIIFARNTEQMPFNSFKRLSDKLSRRNQIERVIEAAAPALPGKSKWWSSPQALGWDYCVREFEHIYTDLEHYLPELSTWAYQVYESYTRERGVREYCGDKTRFAQWRKEVGECLMNGKPVARQKFKVVSSSADEIKDTDEQGIDPLLLACTMLSIYITRSGIDPTKELILYRDPTTGIISYPRKKGEWNEVLIDRGAAAMFCAIPKVRGRRLQQQISILKTFWDMASHFRGRRLCEIIDDNWLLYDK